MGNYLAAAGYAFAVVCGALILTLIIVGVLIGIGNALEGLLVGACVPAVCDSVTMFLG